MFVNYIANGWVVVVESGGKRGSAGIGFLFVLEKGSAVDVTRTGSLGCGVFCWVASLAEFGFQLRHRSVCVFSGGADFLASQKLAIWDIFYLFWWMV